MTLFSICIAGFAVVGALLLRLGKGFSRSQHAVYAAFMSSGSRKISPRAQVPDGAGYSPAAFA